VVEGDWVGWGARFHAATSWGGKPNSPGLKEGKRGLGQSLGENVYREGALEGGGLERLEVKKKKNRFACQQVMQRRAKRLKICTPFFNEKTRESPLAKKE